MFTKEILFFIAFNVFILLLLFLDLKVIGKKNHVIKTKEAFLWSVFWVLLAVGFYFVIRSHGHWMHGIKNIADIELKITKYDQPVNIEGLSYEEALKIYDHNLSLEYITGYLVEESLSVDNLFVMIMIFFAFGVQKKYYKRVLFWGILGALIMRFAFIFGGAIMIQEFEWLLYLFGAFLVYTGIKMFIERNKKEDIIDVSKHPVVKFSSKYLRVYPKYVGNRFFINPKRGKFYFTPLFLVLLVIEFSDLIFATDSIPAIFSITKDPYIIYFSNIFAILGLRSMFFLLLNVIDLFRFLKTGISFLLTYIGFKLLFGEWLKEIGFTTSYSLYIILLILSVSIIASLLFPKKVEKTEEK
jgi:tellurite resistance protein TerC